MNGTHPFNNSVFLYAARAAAMIALCLVTGSSAVAEDVPQDRFLRAAEAYDAERYGEAIAHYEQLLSAGLRAPELYFNLANAYYRAGDRARAILHYKNAEHLAPRDADIQHNLLFAIQQADAAYAPPALPARWLRKLSLPEWIALAVIAWWLTALYVCRALWPSAGRGWGFTASVAVVLLMISLAGTHHWLRFRLNPEVVIIEPRQEALFAPFDRAIAHFTLPPGSIARIDSSAEDWYKVRVGDNDGWIRQAVAAPVTPWKTGRKEESR